ncbi:hypothetical protein RF11_04410 [Thelohanellus kitauei]|uniref:Uncharacterized protein n=1 Tax=Thelohanellus kitauei TaxID=669202 RepID=A0A0C2IVJ5_THEKT|nr:hypothetical protein RF11_04410 [Thelohanellus kitauei]
MKDLSRADELLMEAEKIFIRRGAYSRSLYSIKFLDRMAFINYHKAGDYYLLSDQLLNAGLAFSHAAEIAEFHLKNYKDAFNYYKLAFLCLRESEPDRVVRSYTNAFSCLIKNGNLDGAAVWSEIVTEKLKSVDKDKSLRIINFYHHVIKSLENHTDLSVVENLINKYKFELFEYLCLWEDYHEACKLFDEIVLIMVETTSNGALKIEKCVKTSLVENLSVGPDAKQYADEYCKLPKDIEKSSGYLLAKSVLGAIKIKINDKLENTCNENIVQTSV